MGPLSAVAVAGWLLLYSGNTALLNWWQIRPSVMGWIGIIAAALVVLDVFILDRATAWVRGRRSARTA